LWKLVITVLAAVAGYAAVLGVGDDIAEAPRALGSLGASTWLVLLTLSGINYALRWVRWHGWLRRFGHLLGALWSLTIYLAGFAFTVTPAKAGEAVRAIYLREAKGVPVGRTLSLVYFERLLDVGAMAVLGLGAFGLWLGAYEMAFALALGGITGFVMLTHPAVYRPLRRVLERRNGRIARAASEMLLSTESLLTTRNVLTGLTIGLVAWLAEGAGLALIVAVMAEPVSVGAAIGIYAGGMLAGVASMLPGGLGGAEGFMLGALIRAGSTVQGAAVATVACRLATLWFAVLVGIAAMSVLTVAPWRQPAERPGEL